MLHLIYLPVVMSGYPPVREKGVGATYQQCDYMTKVNATWYYSWGREPALCDGVEAVPMLWGKSSVGQSIGGNSKWLLGFNEPDLSSQANITPVEGAVLWRQVETIYPDKLLVSPAVLTVAWLDAWWSAYVNEYGTTPRVDAVAAHGYAESFTPQAAASLCKWKLSAIIDWAQARGIGEIWVTEFVFIPCLPVGVNGSIEFMDAMTAYFEAEPTITRWAWFQLSYQGTEPWSWGPACNTSLVDYDTGTLTVLGQAYQ